MVEPYRLTPRLALRVAILGGLVLLVFGVLFLRLWALQVLAGTKYVDQARSISSRTVPIQAPRGVILDRNGNVARLERRHYRRRALAGRPAEDLRRPLRRAQRARACDARSAVRDRRCDQGAPGRPRDAGRPAAVGEELDGELPRRARGAVPRRRDAADVHPPLPVPHAGRAGARLRRRDLVAGAEDAGEEGLPAGRRDRPGRCRVLLRHVSPRRRRRCADERRLARTTAQPAGADDHLEAGPRAAADARPEAPAVGGAGARVRHPSGAGGRPVGGARRRDRRDEPERRLHPRHGLVADVRAVRLRGPRHGEGAEHRGADGEDGGGEELSVAEPRAAGDVSAGLGLQAGDGARRAGGASRVAVRDPRVHRDVHGAGGPVASHLPQLGPEREPADGSAHSARVLVRHVLLPTGQRLLRAAERPRPAAAEVGEDLRLRREHRNGRRAGGAGARADDRLAAPAASRRRRIRATGRSTASGSRATRSSWRSARATCSSRRCRWRASTR